MEISSFFITSSIMIVVTLFKKSDSKGFFFKPGKRSSGYLHEYTVSCFITSWIKIIFTCLCNYPKPCYCRNSIIHLSVTKIGMYPSKPAWLHYVFCKTNLSMNASGCQHLRGHLGPFVGKLGHAKSSKSHRNSPTILCLKLMTIRFLNLQSLF